MKSRLLVRFGAVAIGVLLIVAVVRLLKPGTTPEEEEQVAPRVQVSVGAIVRTTLHEYVESWGTVEPRPATPRQPPAGARVSTPVVGILAEVRCAEGGRVQQGAVLFRLDARVADLAVAKAKQVLAFAEKTFERQVALGSGEATSGRQYQEAEQTAVAARNDLENAEALRGLLDVRAPLAGTVVKLTGRPGDAVDPTTVLAEIVDLDRLVVTSAVPSAEVGKVKLGQTARLTARGAPPAESAAAGETAFGEVVFVGAQVDSSTDTVAVRISVPRGSGFRPGQFVNVRILAAEHPDRLAVPSDAVVTDDGAPAIAVVEGDLATKRPVKTGLKDGSLIEVEGDGLREGLTVVTVGAYGLPKECRITVNHP